MPQMLLARVLVGANFDVELRYHFWVILYRSVMLHGQHFLALLLALRCQIINCCARRLLVFKNARQVCLHLLFELFDLFTPTSISSLVAVEPSGIAILDG